MVLGAKLRTVMSSIIRWRNGEILRAVAMAQRNEVMSLMASNNNPIRAGFGDRQFWLTWRAHARRRSGNPSPAKRVSTMLHNGPVSAVVPDQHAPHGPLIASAPGARRPGSPRARVG